MKWCQISVVAGNLILLCQNYMMFLLVLYPPYFDAEYCLFCSRRRMAVARYRMVCLVLITFFRILEIKCLCGKHMWFLFWDYWDYRGVLGDFPVLRLILCELRKRDLLLNRTEATPYILSYKVTLSWQWKSVGWLFKDSRNFSDISAISRLWR